jgi:hypothetical protein
MRLFQARRHSRQQASDAPHSSYPPLTLVSDRDVVSRHEPDSFAPRAVAGDPYTAWVQQREAEREGQPIRWIYRQREQTTRTITSAAREPRRAYDDVEPRSPIELINA